MPLQQGEQAQHDDHVVQQRGHGGDPELVGEPEPHIDQHQAQRHQHGEAGLVTQLVAHLGADELHLEQLQVVDLGVHRLEHHAAHLVGFHAFGGRHADADFPGGAVLLNNGVAEAALGDGAAHLVEVQILLALHHHRGAAGEVQAQVQAAGGEQRDGDHHQGDRQYAEHLARRHEVDVLRGSLTHNRLRYSVWPARGRPGRRSFPPARGYR